MLEQKQWTSYKAWDANWDGTSVQNTMCQKDGSQEGVVHTETKLPW